MGHRMCVIIDSEKNSAIIILDYHKITFYENSIVDDFERLDNMNRGEYIKTRLRARGQLTLPNEVRELLNLEEGDDLVFSMDENGRVMIDRARTIPPDQAWFWTERWQTMERQVQEDIDAGRNYRYANVDDAIADLELPDDAGDRDS